MVVNFLWDGCWIFDWSLHNQNYLLSDYPYPENPKIERGTLKRAK